MKALLVTHHGPPEGLELLDRPDPIPGPGQLVIAVKAAGLNFPDALLVEGKYQVKPSLPFSPGCEVAGVVASVGAEVGGFTVGDRVAAVTDFGGFAEKVAVHGARTTVLPAAIDYPTGAAVLLAHGTSLHALVDRGQLARGETLLVLGAAGGVGLAAVEIGKALGAHVIAAASGAEKLAVCREHGAALTIDYSTEDLREAAKGLTGGRGVDVVYDAVGGRWAEPAVRSLAWKGRYLVVGFASGEIPKIPLNLLLLKGASLVGVYWGEFTKRDPAGNAKNVRQLFDWLAAGTIKPRIGGVLPLARGGEAIRAMMDRRVIGKLVLEP